jgi:predicted nucleic acid-binding protein
MAELENLIRDNRIQLIGTVRQELLSVIRQEAQFKKLEVSLRSFRDLPATTADYALVAQFFNFCRSKGIQGSNTDFLICALAVQNKMSIYTTDDDFTHFAAHLPIVLHRPE